LRGRHAEPVHYLLHPWNAAGEAQRTPYLVHGAHHSGENHNAVARLDADGLGIDAFVVVQRLMDIYANPMVVDRRQVRIGRRARHGGERKSGGERNLAGAAAS